MLASGLLVSSSNWWKEKESENEVAKLCPTLYHPMDCSLPSSSVHGIFQAIVLEWIAISFSRGSSWPRDRTQVSCIVDRRFTAWDTREVLREYKTKIIEFGNMDINALKIFFQNTFLFFDLW